MLCRLAQPLFRVSPNFRVRNCCLKQQGFLNACLLTIYKDDRLRSVKDEDCKILSICVELLIAMDGLSAVAGVATAGVQLAKSLYDLYSTVKTSRKEIEDVASNVLLLSMVLEELDEVLFNDELTFRPQLQDSARSITLRCSSIFDDIRRHIGADQDLKGKKVYEKIAWYFKKERVKPLRSSLEALKSTLSILLHVVQLAKSTKGVEEYP